jgi:hypothetical protein
MLNLRLTVAADKVISKYQTTFARCTPWVKSYKGFWNYFKVWFFREHMTRWIGSFWRRYFKENVFSNIWTGWTRQAVQWDTVAIDLSGERGENQGWKSTLRSVKFLLLGLRIRRKRGYLNFFIARWKFFLSNIWRFLWVTKAQMK